MKLGVSLPQITTFDLAHDVPAFARAAERIGYDSLWAFERLLAPIDQSGRHGLYGMADVPWPERYGYATDPLITLAQAATVTTHVELGTGVLVPPLHLPVRLAKTLAALDTAARGRLIAGLGVGWSIDEFDAAAPRPLGHRGAALEEFLDVAAAVWGPDPVAFQNGGYAIAPARINPKPARRIPIYLGGFSDAALHRIVRRADGWLPTGVPAAQVAATMSRLRSMAAEQGRDPASVDCIFQVSTGSLATVPAEDRRPYTGDIGQLVDDIVALDQVGVDHVYVTLPSAIRDYEELVVAAEALHAAVREAGL